MKKPSFNHNFSFEMRGQEKSIYKNYVLGKYDGMTSEPTFEVIDTFNTTSEEMKRFENKKAEQDLLSLLG